MTHLSLDEPLASLYDLAMRDGRVSSITALAKIVGTSDERFHAARRAGPRIKLATLAAYARAAGWRLCMEVSRETDRGTWTEGGDPSDLGVTVAGARALLAALGLEMTLAVEPAEEAKR